MKRIPYHIQRIELKLLPSSSVAREGAFDSNASSGTNYRKTLLSFSESKNCYRILGIIFCILSCLTIIPQLNAQSTVVSGQITDASTQAWNNGTYTFTFVPSGNNPVGPYTWTGGTLNQTITGSLSATGSYSVSIPSNTAISPVNSVWSARFCPQASSTCFTVNNLTITGGTQTVNATPPTILISLQTAVPPVLAYSTSEITGAVIGSQFYLLGSSGGLQVCSAVSGNSCTTWGSSGGGGVGPITTAWYASPNCASGTNCSFVNGNTHWVCDATTTNTSNIVTAPDGLFLTTAKVGQVVWAVSSACNGATGGLAIAETTILSVDSNTQIHTTANATANNTANATLVWGTLDTPTTGNCSTGTDNVKTAWNAAQAVGASLYLPSGGGTITTGGSGGIMVECAEFQYPSSTLLTNPMNLIGHINSYIIATPNFDFTSIPAGNTGALGTFAATNSNIPNVSILRDVAFMCGGFNTWGTGISSHPIIFAQRVVATNVTGWGCGSSGISAGFQVVGPSTVVAGNFNFFGQSTCVSAGTGQNQTVVFTGTGYCSGPIGLALSSAGNWTTSYGTFYQGFGNTAAVNMSANNQVFNSFGDIIECENSNNTICVKNGGTGSRVGLHGTWVYSTTETAAAFGLIYNAAGSSTAALQSTIQGAGGILVGGGGVTALFEDVGTNTYSGGTVCPTASCTLIADGHSAKGACTGTVAAASTLGLYPLAGATTTCTSTTPNSAPVVVAGARTLQNLVVTAGTGGVNASSGVVTVLRNGATTTITCTLGTGTSCVDSTHTVVAADGDLISIQFTTQTADTLANVKAIVEWN